MFNFDVLIVSAVPGRDEVQYTLEYTGTDLYISACKCLVRLDWMLAVY